MAVRHRDIKGRLKKSNLKAKQISARMKAKARTRRDRKVDTVTETPITLHSKFAWVTIILMVLVIVSASIRVHPMHYRMDYAIVETNENPYIGTLDAPDGFLRSAGISWKDMQSGEDEYAWPDESTPLSGDGALENGQSYVVILNADDVPDYIATQAAERDDSQEYIKTELKKFVTALCGYLSARGDCSYLQTDADLSGMPANIGGIYLLAKSESGLYRAPDNSDTDWQTSPVAGTSEHIFGNHLSYLLDDGDGENIAGRVGYALGVRYAEWHSFTRRGYRLFVNLTLDNAGVTRVYQDMQLVLTLRRGGETCASEVQLMDIGKLLTDPEEWAGYIDIPYDLPRGMYSLCASICAKDSPETMLSLTMSGADGYYELGKVMVK